MELVSTSNHFVYTDGSRWVKKPRNTTDTARVEIARDVAVNRALGRTVEVEDGAMVLEHLGDPVDPEHFHIAEVAQHLRALHRTPVSERDLLTVADWRADVVEKVEERLADHPDAHTWARTVLAAAGPAPAAEVGGLAVSDPHRGNWVRDDTGTLRPLDFETTVWADETMSLACLAHYATVARRPIPADVDTDVRSSGKWFFTMKAVAAVAWLSLATPDAIPARVRLMEASPYWAG